MVRHFVARFRVTNASRGNVSCWRQRSSADRNQKPSRQRLSDEERKYAKTIMKTQHIKRFEAKSLGDLIVDTDGIPRHLCMLDELGHGFDRRAFDAVAGYRFKPATMTEDRCLYMCPSRLNSHSGEIRNF